MGFFDRFKKNKPVQLSQDAVRWNRMLGLWSEGKLDSPYNELVGYYAEVSGDGHCFYFMNNENNDGSADTLNILLKNLPEALSINFKKAYDLYNKMNDEPDENKAEQLSLDIYRCDVFFSENEGILESFLQDYANSL